MKFLVDANLGRKFANLLKEDGHDTIFVNDLLPKLSDDEILSKALEEKRIIVTNDKDFGELTFRLGKASSGVILLRAITTDTKERFSLVKGVLSKSGGKFIVVKEGRVRVRRLQ